MNAIIIPKAQASKYHQIKFGWFHGIDAIEKKDGDFFLLENVFDLIPKDFKITVKGKEVNLKIELSKLPIVDLKPVDFKKTEMMI